MRRPPQRLEVCGAEQPCEPDDRRGSQTGRACVGAGRGRGRGGAGADRAHPGVSVPVGAGPGSRAAGSSGLVGKVWAREGPFQNPVPVPRRREEECPRARLGSASAVSRHQHRVPCCVRHAPSCSTP